MNSTKDCHFPGTSVSKYVFLGRVGVRGDRGDSRVSCVLLLEEGVSLDALVVAGAVADGQPFMTIFISRIKKTPQPLFGTP